MTATCSPLWSMTLPATSLKHQAYIPFYWVTLKVNSTAVGYLQDLSGNVLPRSSPFTTEEKNCRLADTL